MFAVITPVHVHRSEFLLEAYQSLCRQTRGDWRWYILLNGNAATWPLSSVHEAIKSDKRVHIEEAWGLGYEPTVGALKQDLCELSKEPYIVELDYDDMLEPTALAFLGRAFEEGADFVYSDFAEFRTKPNPTTGQIERVPNEPYGAQYGWRAYHHIDADGHDLLAMEAPPVTPQNLRLVEWAPNHVRAWTRELYKRVGGHDPKLDLADDHDLMVRMYLADAKMVHINECLYLYRVHGTNTTATKNKSIRESTWKVYDRHITQLAERFAEDTGTLKVDLCGGLRPFRDYLVLDINIGDKYDLMSDWRNGRRTLFADRGKTGLRCDLNKRWPLLDNSVGVLRAADAIEHLRDPIHTMNEAFRVLRPGGFFLTATPSTNGKGAFCDPTHVSFWNDLSFRYYSDPEHAAGLPAFKGRFQLIKNVEFFPSDWHKQNNMPYVEAHLVKLGEGYAPMGAAWR
jgi:SAM-dependent methyltransferase